MEPLLRCTSCDAEIKTPRTRSQHNQEFTEFLSGPVEVNTVRRYFMPSVPRSEINTLIEGLSHKKLPLCGFCMEFITRIYDFENEIDRIKSLIDSMVTVLKVKMEVALSEDAAVDMKSKTTDFQNVVKLRSLMCGRVLGEQGTDVKVKVEGDSIPDEHELVENVRSTWEKITNTTTRVPETMEQPCEVLDFLDNSCEPEVDDVENDHGETGRRRKSARTKKRNKNYSDYITTGIPDDAANSDCENQDESSAATPTKHKKGQELLEENQDNSTDVWDETNSIDNDISSAAEETDAKSPPKRRKRNPGERRRRKEPKTDRRNRPVTKLGSDQWEFYGYRWKKIENGRYECETCQRTLKTRDSILQHVKISHLGEGYGEYLCPTCGKKFRTRVTFTAHLLIHSELRRHVCEHCGKAFKQKSNLIGHKMIHEKDLEYVCEVEGCGRRFLRKKQHRFHMMRHNGERPHECMHCQKRFIRASELNHHIKVNHEMRDRHPCFQCNKTFGTATHLKRHAKNVHKREESGDDGNTFVDEDKFEESLIAEEELETQEIQQENVVVVMQELIPGEVTLEEHDPEIHGHNGPEVQQEVIISSYSTTEPQYFTMVE